MAISCMRNASGNNYRNSPFIVDLAGADTTFHRTYFYNVFGGTVNLLRLYHTEPLRLRKIKPEDNASTFRRVITCNGIVAVDLKMFFVLMICAFAVTFR